MDPMKTIQELLQARVVCRDEAKAITALADKEKRDLTQDEVKAHGEHTATYDGLTLDIAAGAVKTSCWPARCSWTSTG